MDDNKIVRQGSLADQYVSMEEKDNFWLGYLWGISTGLLLIATVSALIVFWK